MARHTKDLPMDRVERARMTFYHQFEKAMRDEGVAVDMLDYRRKTRNEDHLKHAFQRDTTGVVVDLFGHDGPTEEQRDKLEPERIKTGEIDSEQGVALAYKVTAGSNLDRMYKRGWLTYELWAAAQAHYMIWYLSGQSVKVTVDYGRSVGVGEQGYGMPTSERRAHYRGKLREARKFLGRDTWILVEQVVIDDMTLSDVGYKLREKSGGRCSLATAKRVGGEFIKSGLDALVDFYGIDRKILTE